MATDLATYVAAFSDTWCGLASACAGLTEAEWDTPTDLPGWSVKDNVSHVVGVELLMLGEPFPSHDLPESLPHVRNDAGRFMEVAVDLRRSVPGAAVLAELTDVTERRLKALRALSDADLDAEVPSFFNGRPVVLRHTLAIRVFDCWAHEQDVRRALGRPGGLTSVAARLSRRRLLLGLSRSLSVGAGRVVVVETTGALPSVATLTIGSSYEDVDTPDADARLTMDFETFVRLGCGRASYPAVPVAIEGDAALAEAVLGDFAVTP